MALAVPVGDGTDEPVSDGPSSATIDYVPTRFAAPWQRRTNVWRGVTNPARGAKRPRSGEIRQPWLPVLAHAKRTGLIEAAIAKVKAREHK